MTSNGGKTQRCENRVSCGPDKIMQKLKDESIVVEFFRGMLIATPVSAVLWVVLFIVIEWLKGCF